MPTFNFSSYYLNPALSDVTIKIVTDDGLQEELPGHGIVLANVSMLWKQQIDEGSAITLRVAQVRSQGPCMQAVPTAALTLIHAQLALPNV